MRLGRAKIMWCILRSQGCDATLDEKTETITVGDVVVSFNAAGKKVVQMCGGARRKTFDKASLASNYVTKLLENRAAC